MFIAPSFITLLFVLFVVLYFLSSAIKILKEYERGCVAPFIQKAAAFALNDSAIQDVTANMRAACARRRELVLRLAHELECGKVLVIPPQGAFYFFLDFRPLKMTAVEVCERLREESNVALVPGSAFGEYGEGFVRMTIAASDEEVEAGFRKIVEWAERQP